ncbi:hypothetical protein H9639_04515 [Arthrobacter sp. Sa2CUA1]|uniref:Uncharacterized protein n=1 Tax=Arthrobacter gallicola TaxID=2762225 RepID=A0ABR8UPT7_9MICC|nr:hypothetical protein [Arthrobacter gallicola]MBD7994554.1 hypothetical protein [Arthrobacter gallicola]
MTATGSTQDPALPTPTEDSLSTLALAASQLEAQQWAVDRAEQVLTDLVQTAVNDGLETGSIAAVVGLTPEEIEQISTEGTAS